MNIVGIATIPSRRSELIKTIKSLYKQCDKMFIALNNYNNVPYSLKKFEPKCTFYITDNSKGDAFKFLGLFENLNDDDIYFTCDDDIIYPDDYIEYMAQRLRFYGSNNSIVSLHGREINKFTKNYYKNKERVYHCASELKEDVFCRFLGTGVMCASVELYRGISMDYFEHPNMADIWIAKYASENSFNTYVLKHKSGYLEMQETTKTICHDYYDNCEIQTKIVNDINGFPIPPEDPRKDWKKGLFNNRKKRN